MIDNKEFKKYYKFRTLSKIFCFLSYPIFKLFIKLFIKFKVKFLIKFSIKGPLVLTANHLSFLDPFLIGACLFRDSEIGFLRFMTADSLMKKFGFILKPWGCFPVFYGRGLDVSLNIPKNIIKQGNSVLIFPRGRRIKRFHKKKGKVGAAVLSLENNVPVLPIKVIDSHPGSLINLFLRRRKISITIGIPFPLNEKIKKDNNYAREDFNKATEIIINEINKLR